MKSLQKSLVSDCITSYFSTALTLSAEFGNLDVVTYLVVEKKASLRLTDNDGQ